MGLVIRLLGPPSVERSDGGPYQVRSRKSWALLACLLLAERPPTRARLAAMLYAEADDPPRALRWGLTEIRRSLGLPVDGDPVVLRLPPGAVVDVDVLSRGSWGAALELPGLGGDLLEGVVVRGAPAFESWLLSERRRVAAATEAILHEAALGRLAAGDPVAARVLAVRAAAMNPLDENHQALVIRLYRLAGDDDAADKQHRAVIELFERELGVPPSMAIEEAARASRQTPDPTTDLASIEAIVESGAAAVAAGAVETGVRSLRAAVGLADRADAGRLRLTARVKLAEALIHSLRGMDEEGLASLYEAERIALVAKDLEAAAEARTEIGYVDFLRARYDRAERRLGEALADAAPAVAARVTTYLGAVASDRADYDRARDLFDRGAGAAHDARTESYAHSMAGRVHLLTGDLDAAAHRLDLSMRLAERDHWLAFLPWPQAMRGDVHLAMGETDLAHGLSQQAFARACRLGDPCWEGMSARSLALVAEAAGETDGAFALLADARSRSNRLADPYVWLDAYILDTQCELGLRHHHPDVATWVDALQRLASRSGMREMAAHATRYGDALTSRSAGRPRPGGR
ncbi:BTAD domain-containing putative transcriptional regulator [Actinoplanes sp. NPDC051633]|uniref:BTAD domain-containing putative transcriptional regulator n=1 Tax=Actinoplanes sp. NPDC051633 TaxID=3155670 RepID=UPI003412CA4C